MSDPSLSANQWAQNSLQGQPYSPSYPGMAGYGLAGMMGQDTQQRQAELSGMYAAGGAGMAIGGAAMTMGYVNPIMGRALQQGGSRLGYTGIAGMGRMMNTVGNPMSWGYHTMWRPASWASSHMAQWGAGRTPLTMGNLFGRGAGARWGGFGARVAGQGLRGTLMAGAGLGTAGVGIAAIAGTEAAIQYGTQLYQGAAEMQSGVNFLGQFAPRTMSYSSSSAQAFGSGTLRGIQQNYGIGGGELSAITGTLQQQGEFLGVRDLAEFRGKLMKNLKTLKSLSDETGTTLQQANQLIQTMKGQGYSPGTEGVGAQTLLGRSGSSGVGLDQLLAQGALGGQLTDAMGLGKRLGFDSTTSSIASLAHLYETGAVDRDYVNRLGGVGNFGTRLATGRNKGLANVLMMGMSKEDGEWGFSMENLRGLQSGTTDLGGRYSGIKASLENSKNRKEMSEVLDRIMKDKDLMRQVHGMIPDIFSHADTEDISTVTGLHGRQAEILKQVSKDSQYELYRSIDQASQTAAQSKQPKPLGLFGRLGERWDVGMSNEFADARAHGRSISRRWGGFMNRWSGGAETDYQRGTTLSTMHAIAGPSLTEITARMDALDMGVGHRAPNITWFSAEREDLREELYHSAPSSVMTSVRPDGVEGRDFVTTDAPWYEDLFGAKTYMRLDRLDKLHATAVDAQRQFRSMSKETKANAAAVIQGFVRQQGRGDGKIAFQNTNMFSGSRVMDPDRMKKLASNLKHSGVSVETDSTGMPTDKGKQQITAAVEQSAPEFSIDIQRGLGSLGSGFTNKTGILEIDAISTRFSDRQVDKIKEDYLEMVRDQARYQKGGVYNPATTISKIGQWVNAQTGGWVGEDLVPGLDKEWYGRHSPFISYEYFADQQAKIAAHSYSRTSWDDLAMAAYNQTSHGGLLGSEGTHEFTGFDDPGDNSTFTWTDSAPAGYQGHRSRAIMGITMQSSYYKEMSPEQQRAVITALKTNNEYVKNGEKAAEASDAINKIDNEIVQSAMWNLYNNRVTYGDATLFEEAELETQYIIMNTTVQPAFDKTREKWESVLSVPGMTDSEYESFRKMFVTKDVFSIQDSSPAFPTLTASKMRKGMGAQLYRSFRKGYDEGGDQTLLEYARGEAGKYTAAGLPDVGGFIVTRSLLESKGVSEGARRSVIEDLMRVGNLRAADLGDLDVLRWKDGPVTGRTVVQSDTYSDKFRNLPGFDADDPIGSLSKTPLNKLTANALMNKVGMFDPAQFDQAFQDKAGYGGGGSANIGQPRDFGSAVHLFANAVSHFASGAKGPVNWNPGFSWGDYGKGGNKGGSTGGKKEGSK